MKLKVSYPSGDDLHTILDRTTRVDEPAVERVLTKDEVLAMRITARAVPIARPVQDYAVRITLATHRHKHVRYGSSPRGAQALIIGGKIRALLNDRLHVSCDDIRSVAHAEARRQRVRLSGGS